MSDAFRPIPRRLLAQFLTDHESIKAFEEIQSNAALVLPGELEEVKFSAENAESKAREALSALERIAHALEIIATSPTTSEQHQDEVIVTHGQQMSEEYFALPVIDPISSPHGEMYAVNISQVVAVAASNTAYELAAGLTGGVVRLMSFGGAHYLQAERNGRYLVTWSMAIDTATAADEIEGGIMVDGAASSKGTSHTTVAAVNKSSTISASAIIELNALQQLSLFVRNHTAARNITVEHATMTAVKIGELA